MLSIRIWQSINHKWSRILNISDLRIFKVPMDTILESVLNIYRSISIPASSFRKRFLEISKN